MSPLSQVMIHGASSAAIGNIETMKNSTKWVESINDIYFALLAKFSSKPKSFFKNLIKKNNNQDLFLNARQCLKYGIVDYIGTPKFKINIDVSTRLEIP
jgi:ATP-dependent protease ClpP protease subunit